jgi:hypothetical protein
VVSVRQFPEEFVSSGRDAFPYIFLLMERSTLQRALKFELRSSVPPDVDLLLDNRLAVNTRAAPIVRA